MEFRVGMARASSQGTVLLLLTYKVSNFGTGKKKKVAGMWVSYVVIRGGSLRSQTSISSEVQNSSTAIYTNLA